MYHRVARAPSGTTVPGHYVHPARFRAQVRFLKGLGYEAVSLEAMHAGLRGEHPLPRRPVVFTFDDGYRNFATEAAPALEAAGWRGTVFVVPGLIGATNEWDNRRGDVVEPLLASDEVRALADAGHEVGSHTWSHARLTEVGPDGARTELVRAKEALEQALGRAVPYFCYPYGAHDEEVCRLVREVGHSGACTVLRGKNDAGTDPYRWRRINVRRDTSTPILAWKLLRRSKSGR